MKKITCFICSLSSGGAEHQLTELAGLLYEKGYQVEIVTFADLPDHYTIPKGVKRVKLGEEKSDIRKFLAIFYFFLRVKTDCVITYTQRANTFSLIPLLFRSRKLKVIAGERNNTTYSTPTRFEKLLINIGLYRRADYIVPNSYSQKTYILKKRPQWSSKVITIINYTDLEKYKAVPFIVNEKITIGVFARYNEQKNWKRFADVVRLLKEKTSIPFQIDWFGNKSFKGISLNPEYTEFENLIKKYGIEDILHLHDHVKDVTEVIPQFDVLCLPSLYEGFSNSVAEGICSGKPMLVSNVSDNGVMVHDGVNGFLFDPTNVENMCSAFLRFFALIIEERKQMGIESRKIAESLFKKEQFIDSYIKLIEK